MIKSVWKCINIIAISPKRSMEQAEIMDTFRTYHHSTLCEKICMHDSPPPTLVQSVVASNISTPSLPRNLLQQICSRSCYLTACALGHRHMGPTGVWPICQ